MSTPWAAALGGLAEKRRHLTEAIVALAKVAGVDPAPYLGVPAFVVVDLTKPGGGDLKPKEPETPPRPLAPASPTTNGAGLEDKVLQSLKLGPRAPKAIGETTGIDRYRLRVLLNELRSSKKIRRTGSGPRNTQYQLS